MAQCDGILLLIDVSDPECDAQLKVTTDLLSELGASEKPILYVLNKCDKDRSAVIPFMGKDAVGKILMISAKSGEGIDALVSKLEELADDGKKTVDLFLPSDSLGVLSKLYTDARILELNYTDGGAEVKATLDMKLLGQLKRYIVSGKDDPETPEAPEE